MEYGYVRVSSKTQNPDRQIRGLKKNGILEKNIYIDYCSGSTFHRPAFKKLMRKIRPGDVIFFVSFDRLGRNYDETIERWTYITKKKKTDIVILDLPILDTRAKASGIMGHFLIDLIVQIMAYLVDVERRKNKEAQREGIEAKKARGEWADYGRPRKVPLERFQVYYELVEKGKLTLEDVQQKLNISAATYKRYVNELKNAT